MVRTGSAFAFMQRFQSGGWLPDFVGSIESQGVGRLWQYHNQAGMKEEKVETK